MAAYPDLQEHLDSLWDMIAFASRYGHAPPSETLGMTMPTLVAFNDAIARRIKAENERSNKTGGMSAFAETIARGGG